MTEIADCFTRFIEEFRWERSRTDTCAISFHDAEDITNFVGTNAQASTCTGADRVGRRDERIASEVDVEHRTLSPFAENGLTLLQNTIDLMFGIYDGELTEILNTLEPLLLDVRDVILKVERLQDGIMSGLCLSIFLLEVIKNVAHAETITGNLIRISRTNTLTSGANLVFSLLGFIGSIEDAVGRHDQMGLLGDMEA